MINFWRLFGWSGRHSVIRQRAVFLQMGGGKLIAPNQNFCFDIIQGMVIIKIRDINIGGYVRNV